MSWPSARAITPAARAATPCGMKKGPIGVEKFQPASGASTSPMITSPTMIPIAPTILKIYAMMPPLLAGSCLCRRGKARAVLAARDGPLAGLPEFPQALHDPGCRDQDNADGFAPAERVARPEGGGGSADADLGHEQEADKAWIELRRAPHGGIDTADHNGNDYGHKPWQLRHIDGDRRRGREIGPEDNEEERCDHGRPEEILQDKVNRGAPLVGTQQDRSDRPEKARSERDPVAGLLGQRNAALGAEDHKHAEKRHRHGNPAQNCDRLAEENPGKERAPQGRQV